MNDKNITLPNAESREIRFVDSSFQQLFMLPDGANIILTELDGTQRILPCHYIGAYYVRVGEDSYHILEFAELQERRGAIYAPEYPDPIDICDSYELYQLKDPKNAKYGFYAYELAKGKLHPADYEKMYANVLGPGITLRELFVKHTRDTRPFRDKIHAMSVSDVVVIRRSGRRYAFYVDRADSMDRVRFVEAKRFLKIKSKRRKRAEQER